MNTGWNQSMENNFFILRRLNFTKQLTFRDPRNLFYDLSELNTVKNDESTRAQHASFETLFVEFLKPLW